MQPQDGDEVIMGTKEEAKLPNMGTSAKQKATEEKKSGGIEEATGRA